MTGPTTSSVSGLSVGDRTTLGRESCAGLLVHSGRLLSIALALTLPFEVKFPVFRVGPVDVTNTELLLYLTVGCWLAARILGWRPAALPLRWPVLVLAAGFIVSAAFAQSERDFAVKFALRMTSGCLLAVAVSELINSWRHVTVLLSVTVAGAVLSSLAGVLEIEAASIQRALMPFKTQATFTSGFLRASGTFQYANTAAMYWEACLPLLIGLAALPRVRAAGRSYSWLALAALAILSTGLVASASRAGLIGAAVTLAFVAWLGGRKVPVMRRLGLLALGLLVVIFALHGLRTGLLALRLRTSDTSQWHRALWVETPTRVELDQGELARIPIRLRNIGVLSWTARGEQPVYVSYHWMRTSNTYSVFEGARSLLPHDVAPGEAVDVTALVFGNVAPGSHTLQWDLVREGVTWFSVEGGPVATTVAEILPRQSAPLATRDLELLKPRPELRPPRRVLWRSAWNMWLERPLVGVGPDNFRHLYGPYAGMREFDDRITANSWFFEMLSTLGLTGLVVWTWLTVTLVALARRWWQAPVPAPAAIAGVCFAGGLVAFAVHGLVDYFLAYTPTLGLFWLLVGAAARVWSPAGVDR